MNANDQIQNLGEKKYGIGVTFFFDFEFTGSYYRKQVFGFTAVKMSMADLLNNPPLNCDH